MLALAHQAPKINWDDLTQIPALPLGSWLKTDPWDDRVHQINAKLYAPMNPRDKMPLEVTPLYFKLQRYDAKDAQPAPPGQQPAAPAADPNNPPANGNQQAPAAVAPQGTPGQPSPQTSTQPINQDTSAQQQTPAAPQLR